MVLRSHFHSHYFLGDYPPFKTAEFIALTGADLQEARDLVISWTSERS